MSAQASEDAITNDRHLACIVLVVHNNPLRVKWESSSLATADVDNSYVAEFDAVDMATVIETGTFNISLISW